MWQNRSHDADVMMTYTWNLPNVGMIMGIRKQEPMVNCLPPSKNLSNLLFETKQDGMNGVVMGGTRYLQEHYKTI